MSDQNISANLQTLFDQAQSTAATYMKKAAEAIDDTFGEGHAKKNPALVAAFMQAAAVDLHGSLLKVGLQQLSDAVYATAATNEEEFEDET